MECVRKIDLFPPIDFNKVISPDFNQVKSAVWIIINNFSKDLNILSFDNGLIATITTFAYVCVKKQNHMKTESIVNESTYKLLNEIFYIWIFFIKYHNQNLNDLFFKPVTDNIVKSKRDSYIKNISLFPKERIKKYLFEFALLSYGWRYTGCEPSWMSSYKTSNENMKLSTEYWTWIILSGMRGFATQLELSYFCKHVANINSLYVRKDSWESRATQDYGSELYGDHNIIYKHETPVRNYFFERVRDFVPLHMRGRLLIPYSDTFESLPVKLPNLKNTCFVAAAVQTMVTCLISMAVYPQNDYISLIRKLETDNIENTFKYILNLLTTNSVISKNDNDSYRQNDVSTVLMEFIKTRYNNIIDHFQIKKRQKIVCVDCKANTIIDSIDCTHVIQFEDYLDYIKDKNNRPEHYIYNNLLLSEQKITKICPHYHDDMRNNTERKFMGFTHLIDCEEIIIIHISYNYNNINNKNKIQFTPQIDIPILKGKHSVMRYGISCQIIHNGNNFQSGHYYIKTKRRPIKLNTMNQPSQMHWYSISDDFVDYSLIDPNVGDNSRTCILIYQYLCNIDKDFDEFVNKYS